MTKRLTIKNYRNRTDIRKINFHEPVIEAQKYYSFLQWQINLLIDVYTFSHL